jgi:hypothetical protein
MYVCPVSNQKQNQQTSNLGYRKSIMNSTNTSTGKIQAQRSFSAHTNGVLLHLSEPDHDLLLELLEQVHERLECFQMQIRQVQQMLSQMIRFFVATVLCLLVLIGSLFSSHEVDVTQSPAAMSSVPLIELGGRHAGF